MTGDIFSVSDHFFVIDSDSLKSVGSRLYGYYMNRDSVVENDDITCEEDFPDAFSSGGLYTAVKRSGDEITIYQDYNGSYGLYLYRDGSYFALSNSFLYLLEHLKGRKLSLNRSYALHLFRDICSISYMETAVNEIVRLKADTIIHIDIPTGKIREETLDFRKKTVDPGSPEGLAILDDWYNRWTALLRSLCRKTDNFSAQLSGGFDSRVTFMLLLTSGADLHRVNIMSMTDGLHTHSEDYEIASRIASDFGLLLNRGNLSEEAVNCTLKDMLNISFYSKLFFHNQLVFMPRIYTRQRFLMGGAGGGSIRACWDYTPEEFIEDKCRWAEDRFGAGTEEAAEFRSAIESVIRNTFDAIDEKFHLQEQDPREYARVCLREARCGNHFGKYQLEQYFTNVYNLSPLLDQGLCMLRTNDGQCSDNNLLIALIFDRYCPKLLDYPFDSGRSVAQSTKEYAHLINSRSPYKKPETPKTTGESVPHKSSPSSLPQADNPLLDKSAAEQFVQNVFDDELVRARFSSVFSDRIYRFAKNYAEKTAYFPMAHENTVAALSVLLKQIAPFEDTFVGAMQRSQKKDPHRETRIDDNLSDYMKEYLTLRLDVRMAGSDSKILLTDISDPQAKVIQPEWILKDSDGYVISSWRREAKLVFRCDTAGEVCIDARGMFKKNKANEWVPRWVYIDSLTVNGKEELRDKAVWHNAPQRLRHQVKAGDTLVIGIRWSFADMSKAQVMPEPPAEKSPQNSGTRRAARSPQGSDIRRAAKSPGSGPAAGLKNLLKKAKHPKMP